MATWEEEIERFQRFASRGAKIASAPYLAIVALEVAVAASALPYVYAGDVKGSCGARFIVHYGMHNIATCARALAVIFVLTAVCHLGAQEMLRNEARFRPRMEWMRNVVAAAFSAPIVFFLLFVVSQVAVIANPPPLPVNPEDVKACVAMGDQK
jgi:hypothetical protein